LLEPMPRREVWSLVVAGSPAVYDYDYSGFTDVEWRYAIVDPMFYQDTSRSYFVSPKSYFDWAGYLASPKRDEESYWVDGSQFATFYHPYVEEFRTELIREGLKGLLSLQTQSLHDSGSVMFPGATKPTQFDKGAVFLTNYVPTRWVYHDYP